LLEKSELIIAQEFLPTAFDWRVGIFDRQPLFACRYYMAKRHWQILRRDPAGLKTAEGRSIPCRWSTCDSGVRPPCGRRT
jgi:glutathione synthase/RimK-type ligase-like ATP-grasp enzyme